MLIRSDIEEILDLNDVAQMRSAFGELVVSEDEREVDIDDPDEFRELFARLCAALGRDNAEMPQETVAHLNARLDEGSQLLNGASFADGVNAAQEIADDLF
ncbi:hypothetical protein [Methylorubrum extorquens]|uniref:Uncharacterized protein n=1 Tax=Methylorubrum extorquens (strain ATCC 14718 / DSM 1338 / JCM 2805 / NCIMB 9133 / AM1) TaxID=272630 RepID=C5B6X0_METEA|nr:hypothetical protein [Methylorubrum extorquens]ACS44202.1 Hypothetical protein MexAM1_p3METAp0028 [Methylorubrum extorquens AM1]MCP1591980.1 hypothetical protein [Methylorubrum extorquens]